MVNSNLCNMIANSASVKVVSRGDIAMGSQRANVSFHLASIPRPQDVYRILVNNVNKPFEHVWLPMSEDGSRFIHPLENLSVFNFVDMNIMDIKPVRPPAVECTPFKLVQEVKDLKELVAKLQDASEFAVDLEHNQYRSFQGLTCLMQISTRAEDFIVDTLKLRVHIGPYLREIFKDPTKKKVMHGADKDILWLQRDFGIYVCNMFDTGQASRVLRMERNSLEYLLLHFCGIAANKEYQTADWRLRPLTDEMLRYAREDTHYLLHIYDVMKIRLVLSSPDPNFPEALVEVYQRSYDVCMQLYQKDILTKYSYLSIYGLHAADLNGQQLAIVAGLCEWRDIVARAEDESTGYILPNRSLIEIAKHMPVTTGELRRLLKFKHPHVERNLGSVVSVIEHSMQNAAAFENVANRLKQERLEMEAVRMAQKIYEEASFRPIGAAGAHSCSQCVANQFGNNVGSLLPRINRNHQLQGSSVHAGGNWDVMNRSRLTSTKSLRYGSGTSGWAQKDRRSCGFGIGMSTGKAAGNRKFDRGKKAMEETKVKQMKPSLNLPGSSFTKKMKPLHSAMKEPANAQEAPNHKEPTATSSKQEQEHIIILQKSGSVTAEEKHDREEKPVSLSDLSSSFQKLLEMKTAKPEEGGGGGLSEVEQFAGGGKEVSTLGEEWDEGKSMKKCGKDGTGEGSRDF